MELLDEVLKNCAYFYEVLIRNFTEFEERSERQNKKPFYKVDFIPRIEFLKGMKERAVEAKTALPIIDEKDGNNKLYLLANKLSECLVIYIYMIESQILINYSLQNKANKKNSFSMPEFLEYAREFDMRRGCLEKEMAILLPLYSKALLLKENELKQKEATLKNTQSKYIVANVLSLISGDSLYLDETLYDIWEDKNMVEEAKKERYRRELWEINDRNREFFEKRKDKENGEIYIMLSPEEGKLATHIFDRKTWETFYETIVK